MDEDSVFEDVEKLTDIVDIYMDIENISEGNLYIDIQLEQDQENEGYVIDYCIMDQGGEISARIGGKFSYDELEDAWSNYVEQIPELHQNYPKATIKSPSPETYESAKGGGNPAARRENGSKEF